MKNNEKEQQFEVIISPTDLMTHELEEILGGGGSCEKTNLCWENNFDCNVNICKTNLKPCPEGYVKDDNGNCIHPEA